MYEPYSTKGMPVAIATGSGERFSLGMPVAIATGTEERNEIWCNVWQYLALVRDFLWRARIA